MKKVIIIALIALSSSVMAQNSPWMDTVKFIRGGKIYKLVMGTSFPNSLTINGVTYGTWAQYGGKIRPLGRGNWINYPGIKYLYNDGFARPDHNGPVWWRQSDSTLVMPNPGAGTLAPVFYIGADTNSGWRITADGASIKFEFKSAGGWVTKKSIDTTGTFYDEIK